MCSYPSTLMYMPELPVKSLGQLPGAHKREPHTEHHHCVGCPYHDLGVFPQGRVSSITPEFAGTPAPLCERHLADQWSVVHAKVDEEIPGATQQPKTALPDVEESHVESSTAHRQGILGGPAGRRTIVCFRGIQAYLVKTK